MKQNKPENIEEYKKWFKDFLKIDIDNKTENHYNSVANKIKIDFEKSKVWIDIIHSIPERNIEYLSKTGYPLLINEFKPELVTKPFSSFFEKSFRKNVILNKKWNNNDDPQPPSGGWITPDNWFERINDILRTYFVVKYLDGVDFLMGKIVNAFHNEKLKCHNYFEARDEGYYAVHIYVINQFEIPQISWNTENKNISIEIQITTQLQDVIRKLTHMHYENRRVCSDKTDKKWQWDYQSDEFTPNYLGHILHYLEGMIMEVRQRQSK